MSTARKANAFPFPTAQNHRSTAPEPTIPPAHQPSEDAIDSGIEESFPASDPVSVTVTKSVTPTKHDPPQKK